MRQSAPHRQLVASHNWRHAERSLQGHLPADTFRKASRLLVGRQLGRRLASQAKVQNFNLKAAREQPAFAINYIVAGLCDAIAKKDDTMNAPQRSRRAFPRSTHGECRGLE